MKYLKTKTPEAIVQLHDIEVGGLFQSECSGNVYLKLHHDDEGYNNAFQLPNGPLRTIRSEKLLRLESTVLEVWIPGVMV